jgi:hypothetical protein
MVESELFLIGVHVAGMIRCTIEVFNSRLGLGGRNITGLVSENEDIERYQATIMLRFYPECIKMYKSQLHKRLAFEVRAGVLD